MATSVVLGAGKVFLSPALTAKPLGMRSRDALPTAKVPIWRRFYLRLSNSQIMCQMIHGHDYGESVMTPQRAFIDGVEKEHRQQGEDVGTNPKWSVNTQMSSLRAAKSLCTI